MWDSFVRPKDETTALPALYMVKGICNEFDDLALDKTKSRHLFELKADIISLTAIVTKPQGKEGQVKALEYIDITIKLHKKNLRTPH